MTWKMAATAAFALNVALCLWLHDWYAGLGWFMATVHSMRGWE